MKQIFVSYRRTENAALIGRIYDRLVSEFGKDSVFLDVDSIPLGADFGKYLHEQVSQCTVFVLVIGSEWQAKIENLHHEKDFVRIEIETALQSQKLIIPLLVEVGMPSAHALPDTLKALTGRNGMKLDTGQDFHSHMARFVTKVSDSINAPSSKRPTLHIKLTSSVVANVIDEIQEMLEHPGRTSGASSGFESIDRLTNGFESENTYVFAAQPNSGLSSFLLSIADRVLAQDRYSVLWIETSTSEESVMLKLMCNMSVMSPAALREGLLTRRQQECLARCTRSLQRARLTIVSSLHSIDNLLNELFLTEREQRPDIVIIDEFTSASTSMPEGTFAHLTRLAKLARFALICGVRVEPTKLKALQPSAVFHQSKWAQEISNSASFVGWLSTSRDPEISPTEVERADSRLTALINKKGSLGVAALTFWPDFWAFSSLQEDKVGSWSWVHKTTEREEANSRRMKK